jgi:hypothetical protein
MKMEKERKEEKEREAREWLAHAVHVLEETAAALARATVLFRRGERLAALLHVRDALMAFNSVKKEAERRMSRCFADFVDGRAYTVAVLWTYSALQLVEREVCAALWRALTWGIDGEAAADVQWAMQYVAAVRRTTRLALRMFFN